MACVFSEETLEEALEQAGDYMRLEAARALYAAGRVASAEPTHLGVRGTVQDVGAKRQVWVGIRQWMLVGECDCPDADPLVSSEEHLTAVAAGRAETPGPCAHALALALAAMAQKLPWAAPPEAPRPGTRRAPRTTPPPPVDITRVFPELAAFARQAIRLHPRRGEPGVHDSSLGGPLLWPAGEAWPACTQPHSHRRRFDVPREITSWQEADAWARITLGHRARVSRYTWRHHGGGPAEAVIDLSGPPPIPSPMVSVLQMYAHHVPGLPFPDDTDCFQFLWCPNEHLPWGPMRWGPNPAFFWRRAATVTEVLGNPPEPRFDSAMNASRYHALPCLLNPEPVTEYPGYADLPEPLRQRVARWNSLTAGLYREVLSVAPGTKASGYPEWIEDPEWPDCGCRRRMDHLVTIASGEWDHRLRWIPPEDRNEALAGEHYEASITHGLPAIPNWVPHDITLGDVGSMYLFTCAACQDHPVQARIRD